MWLIYWISISLAAENPFWEKGIQHFEKKEFQEAIQNFEAYLKKPAETHFIEATLYLAKSFIGDKKWTQAEPALLQLLKIDTQPLRKFETLTLLTQSRIHRGAFQEAQISAFEAEKIGQALPKNTMDHMAVLHIYRLQIKIHLKQYAFTEAQKTFDRMKRFSQQSSLEEKAEIENTQFELQLLQCLATKSKQKNTLNKEAMLIQTIEPMILCLVDNLSFLPSVKQPEQMRPFEDTQFLLLETFDTLDKLLQNTKNVPKGQLQSDLQRYTCKNIDTKLQTLTLFFQKTEESSLLSSFFKQISEKITTIKKRYTCEHL